MSTPLLEIILRCILREHGWIVGNLTFRDVYDRE